MNKVKSNENDTYLKLEIFRSTTFSLFVVPSNDSATEKNRYSRLYKEKKRKMPSLVYSDPSDTRDPSKKAPFLPRKLEACNDVELNPGPKSPTKKQSKTANNNNNNQNIMNNVDSREMMPAHDLPRVKKLGKILKQQDRFKPC